MRRRDFITVLAGAAAYPLFAGAQQEAKPVIGLLMSVSSFAPLRDATRQGLAETGFVAPAQWGEHAEGRAEGQNVAIEYRLAESHYDRLPALAADLVGRKVDVILTIGGELPARAAKGATSTIPIVSIFGADPVDAGLVASLARPGGNLTGFTLLGTELTAKRLELLSELVPQAGVVALLVDPDYPQTERITREAQQAARAKGVRLAILKAGTASEIDEAFSALVQLYAGALLVGGSPFYFFQREQLVALAARHAVPAIYGWREFPEADGLISYGTSVAVVQRQAGVYVGRILKGAKPADLPFQQPTRFELVINLKTARALGLTISHTVLLRADEVIE